MTDPSLDVYTCRSVPFVSSCCTLLPFLFLVPFLGSSPTLLSCPDLPKLQPIDAALKSSTAAAVRELSVTANVLSASRARRRPRLPHRVSAVSNPSATFDTDLSGMSFLQVNPKQASTNFGFITGNHLDPPLRIVKFNGL
jgi:hypothetical protein